MTTSTAPHFQNAKTPHWLIALISVFLRDLIGLITVGPFKEFFGSGYQPSARAITAKQNAIHATEPAARAFTTALHRFVALNPWVHRTPHTAGRQNPARRNSSATGRQGHARRRPARKTASSGSRGGDDGDGGADGGGEPPHRISFNPTQGSVGGAA
ncbi:MAG: hypothetical protein WCY67_06210 [Acidithiobacillus sp.]